MMKCPNCGGDRYLNDGNCRNCGSVLPGLEIAQEDYLNPNVKPAPDCIRDKHFFRKHGENAYYGQD